MIYARSDIQSITVSEAHGGCGQPHVRPEGEHTWGLACERCGDHLRGSALWSDTEDSIPATYDEQQAEQAREKNFAKRQFHAAESAAGLLALLAGPQDLLAGTTAKIAPAAECRKCGAGSPAEARFCLKCGAPMLREAGAA